MFIRSEYNFILRVKTKLLDYTPHSDQNGSVEVKYNFILHKS